MLLLMLMLSSMLQHMLYSISTVLLEHMLYSISTVLLEHMLNSISTVLLEHMLNSISSMPSSISSMLLSTAVQQRRKRIRQRRQRRAFQHRQRQQQNVERCEKLRSTAQPVRDARGVVCQNVQHNRSQHRRPRHARRQPLTLPVFKRRERQRQIRQLYSDRRKPAREVAARRGEGTLDAQRAWGAQQQNRQRCENAELQASISFAVTASIFLLFL